MGKIALETEVYANGGKGSPVSNKCCTKARAEALGCKIKSGYSYTSNQLIEQGSYEKDITYYIGIPYVNKITNGIDIIWPFMINTIPTTKPANPEFAISWNYQGQVVLNGHGTALRHFYGMPITYGSNSFRVNNGFETLSIDVSLGDNIQIGYYNNNSYNGSNWLSSIITYGTQSVGKYGIYILAD